MEALRARRPPFFLGYTKRAAYRHPVFRTVFAKGTYPKGLCPNAESMVPRIILAGTMMPMDAATRQAEGLCEVVEELSR